MPAEMVRLLSPTHRRIFAPKDDDDLRTAGQLQECCGWTNYVGPATVNAQGFVIPGSDPDIVPVKRH
jgi:hypothetical protein